jgi:SAM-dependent methyltransferase
VSAFRDFAEYYDILYREKDYGSEAASVLKILRKWRPDARAVLELGCGTGAHARHLAESGIFVHGIDCSVPMLEQARMKQQALPADVASRLGFSHGDMRQVRLNRRFDGIISLFHVFSYQVLNEDIRATLLTVREHLNPGGVLIFDCWYGPAVLTERPTVRVKRWENHETEIIRIAEPTIYPDENRVDVNYTILVRSKMDDRVKELKELHRLRYLFRPEIEMFTSLAGLEISDAREWMTENEPGLGTWNVCFVVRG